MTLACAVLTVSACAVAPGSRGASKSQLRCAATEFPANERIDAWSVDKFAGRYKHGSDTVTVGRFSHRLMIEGWSLGSRELTAPNVESWTWRDGCGVSYAFVLPPDGPGAWLKITLPDGSVTDWHR